MQTIPRPTLQAGWAEVEFTPPPGLPLLGQMHQRIATHARDPLCAVALALRSPQQTVVMVACDVCILDNAFITKAQQSFAAGTGLEAKALLVHATHTHVAPISSGALMGEALPAFEDHLQGKIIEAARTALENLEPVEVFAANGYLEQLGWNRRAMFEDGTSRMYGHSGEPGFTGMEGPRDGHLPLLWTKNMAGTVTGVLTGFATHPNCLENEYFYSADLPGAARKYLKQMLSGPTKVLYLTGAAGNTAPSILEPFDANYSWRGEAGVERSGLYLAGEAAKVIAQTNEPMVSPVLDLQRTELQVPLRAWPSPGEATYPQWPGIEYYAYAETIWPQRLQAHNPFPLHLNLLRIGEAVICTNSAELFVEFGLQIKDNSPARVTFISELTDGYCGYIPTEKAFSRGGYETWCAPSSQLSFDAGARIVTTTQELLAHAWSR